MYFRKEIVCIFRNTVVLISASYGLSELSSGQGRNPTVRVGDRSLEKDRKIPRLCVTL